MTCIGDRVTPLVDGRLPADAADRAYAHAAVCDTCREAVEAERLTKARLVAMATPEPGPALITSLLLIGGPTGPLPPREGRVPGTARPLPVVVGAGAAARPQGAVAPTGRRDRRRPGGRVAGRLSRRRQRTFGAAVIGALSIMGLGAVALAVVNLPSDLPAVNAPVDTAVLRPGSPVPPFTGEQVTWVFGRPSASPTK